MPFSLREHQQIDEAKRLPLTVLAHAITEQLDNCLMSEAQLRGLAEKFHKAADTAALRRVASQRLEAHKRNTHNLSISGVEMTL